MNTSSVVLWLAEVPWGYSLAGRWTALLILAWGVHVALAGRNPRWRVLLWRSAAVGLATIVLTHRCAADRHLALALARSRSSSKGLLRKASCRWRTRCRFCWRGQRRLPAFRPPPPDRIDVRRVRGDRWQCRQFLRGKLP